MKVKLWHGRNYCSVGNELEHPAKISSISYSNGRIGVTMLNCKWTLWSNKVVTSEEMKLEEEGGTLKYEN
jgi:hypothetical protein